MLDRVERLVATAGTLRREPAPGPAFYQFIEVMAVEGRTGLEAGHTATRRLLSVITAGLQPAAAS